MKRMSTLAAFAVVLSTSLQTVQARGFYVPPGAGSMYPPPVMVPGRLPNPYIGGYYGLGFAAQGFQIVPWPNQGPPGIWQQPWMWPVRPWIAR